MHEFSGSLGFRNIHKKLENFYGLCNNSMRAPELPRNCSHSHSIHATYELGCANKDLDGSLGPLGTFLEYS